MSRHLPCHVIVWPAADIATKSRRTRRSFHDVLAANIRDAFARLEIPARVQATMNHIDVHLPDETAADRVLGRVFGIAGYAPVTATCEPDLDAIVRAGTEAFAESVRGRTFAVRAKRAGPVGFGSQDVNVALGAALNGIGTVKLREPDVTLRLEVDSRTCRLFGERRSGAGGLPAGAQGRGLVLLSGGFDSAVAAWRVMRRGVAVDFVFCNLGGGAYERMVLQIAKVLCEGWGYGLRPVLHVLDFAPVVADLRDKVRDSYRQILLKRLMLRAAGAIAGDTGAQALITGEALGQVSSQTLSNLNSIDTATDLPLIRPLIAADKAEIVETARHIGTAVLSQRVREYCAVSDGPPETSSRRPRVMAEEARLDPAVFAAALGSRRTIDLHEVGPTDLRAPYLFAETIPEAAVVIDCQPPAMYSRWHAPGAVNMDPQELAADYRRLDKGRTYVLYCAFGTQTPVLAEIMQQAGYEAYAFAGGLSSLRRALEDV